MSGYAMFEILTVNDPAGLAEYVSKATPIVENFGGFYVVRGGEWETLEGSYRPSPFLIKFPDLDAARRWYHSAEYRPFRELRHRSGTYNGALLTGIEPYEPHE
jgi:uncharacterized protein (DUF1330 family)